MNNNLDNNKINNIPNSIITLSVESQEQDNEIKKLEVAIESPILNSEEIEQAVNTINETKEEKINYLFSLSKADLFSNNENEIYSSIFFYDSKIRKVRKIKLMKSKFNKTEYPKKYFKTLMIDNTHIITGGKNFENETINNVYQIKYDPIKDYAFINILPKMLYLRQNHNMVYLPYYNYIVVCGGFNLRTTEYIDLDDLANYEKENSENELQDYSKYNKSKFKWKTIDKNLNKSICDAMIFVLNDTMIFLVGGYDNEKGIITNEYEMIDFREKKMIRTNKKWKVIKLNKNESNFFNDIFMGGLYISKNEVAIFGGKNMDKEHNIKYFKLTQNDENNSNQNGDDFNINIICKNNSFLDQNKFKFEYYQLFNNNISYYFELENYQNNFMNQVVAYLLPNGDLIKYGIHNQCFSLEKFDEK